MKRSILLACAAALVCGACAAPPVVTPPGKPNPPIAPVPKTANLCDRSRPCPPNIVSTNAVQGGQCRVTFNVAVTVTHPGQTVTWVIPGTGFDFPQAVIGGPAVRGIDILDIDGRPLDPRSPDSPFTNPTYAPQHFSWTATRATSSNAYNYTINVVNLDPGVDQPKCLVYDPIIVNDN